MSHSQSIPDLEQLSFEEALSRLEAIVRDLESGKTTLEGSIAAYEQGVTLKQHCEQKLRQAQMKVESIAVRADGTVATAPFESK